MIGACAGAGRCRPGSAFAVAARRCL